MNHSSARQSYKVAGSISSVVEAATFQTIKELGAYLVVKRLADIVVSALCLIVLSPLMLAISLVIRASSNGPSVFCQQRIGQFGDKFTVYKFRTMVINAPHVPTEKMQESSVSYCTNVGMWLRRCSLDELPQLWNVLRGDMSMIGPRPSLEVQTLLNTRRGLTRVHDLKPGITGLAQVSGRDSLTDDQKVAFDSEYRSRCSFLLDCQIAFRTVDAVFNGTGAN